MRNRRLLTRWRLGALLTMLLCVQGRAEEAASRSSVPISFLPPPLEEATFSVGIYEAKSGKLVRRLHEMATESAFTAGLNGLITKWDGKDDEGKPVPPGKFAARGYAVGPLKVEGVDILGNDWAADDEALRIKHVEAISYVPADGGVIVLARLAGANAAVLRFSGEGKVLWRQPVSGLSADDRPWFMNDAGLVFVLPRQVSRDGVLVNSVATFKIDDGTASNESRGLSEEVMLIKLDTPPVAGDISTSLADPQMTIRSGVGASKPSPEQKSVPARAAGPAPSRSPGKGDTLWSVAGLNGLIQTDANGDVLRKLEVAPGDPLPVAVSASTDGDKLYLLEEKEGWQRVRGLSWRETKEEEGKQVSTWQTFFERNIRKPDPKLGLDGPAGAVEIALVENPLEPGKPETIKLNASVDEKGSYLIAADGLRLRQISQRTGLTAAVIPKRKQESSLTFFQTDGAAWDEFSIYGIKEMMSFDAGEFELTAKGEKPVEKPTEPPDL